MRIVRIQTAGGSNAGTCNAVFLQQAAFQTGSICLRLPAEQVLSEPYITGEGLETKTEGAGLPDLR